MSLQRRRELFERLARHCYGIVCDSLKQQYISIPTLTVHFDAKAIAFPQPRDFAVTTVSKSESIYRMDFSTKIHQQSLSRMLGILRHEMGHFVDFLLTPCQLIAWVEGQQQKSPENTTRKRLIPLIKYRELRADFIAELLWKAPLYYDAETVQSSVYSAGSTFQRPKHLLQ